MNQGNNEAWSFFPPYMVHGIAVKMVNEQKCHSFKTETFSLHKIDLMLLF